MGTKVENINMISVFCLILFIKFLNLTFPSLSQAIMASKTTLQNKTSEASRHRQSIQISDIMQSGQPREY